MWKSGLASLVVAAAVAIPAGLSAQDQEPPPAAEYRTALMVSLQNHMSAVSALVAGDVAYMGHLQTHAAAVDGIATMASEAFPEGTAEGSRSSQDIWDNWEVFMEKMQVLQSGASALNAAAQAGDLAAVEVARGEVMGSCRGCHMDYRLPASGN